MMLRAVTLAGFTAALALTIGVRGQESTRSGAVDSSGDSVRLIPTRHPDLPTARGDYWLVPDVARLRAAGTNGGDTPADRFARGARLIAAGDHATGLPLVGANDLTKTEISGYARLYAARALSGLSRLDEADRTLTLVWSARPRGYLREVVARELASVALARGDARRAVDLLSSAADETVLEPEVLLLQLASAAERAGDLPLALSSFRRIYYDYPLSVQAVEAEPALARLETPEQALPDALTRDTRRAEALYTARRWAAARAAFERLSRVVEGPDRTLATLRMAQCDYYQNRFRPAREALKPHLDAAPRSAEARYFHLSATRELGDRATYVKLAREFVEDHPRSSWAEETLNDLATHYVVSDDDAAADLVFRQLAASFPTGRYAERAAWRIGWRAYRAGQFREAISTFERAAEAFPRADYRPAWLYWSGRARQQLDDMPMAARRLALVVADYQNSYYGRLSDRILAKVPDSFLPERLPSPAGAVAKAGPIATDAVIRQLISLELYDDALGEVQFAQRVWGDSPQLQATSAFVRHNKGLGLKAEERFTAVRGAITTMRRAYPQFMAAGGERIPDEVLRIIFPLDYWPLITKYAKRHDLDPYLIAALMVQESTFTAEIRSSANAIGLMQLIPATGRRYARQLGIRNFSTASLRDPETNVRLGTEYFKDLVKRFGSAHYALASYNAGENRVQSWIDERGQLPADEFTDDIPFAETQNYIKRILGTTDDYRRLYGAGRLDPNVPVAVPRPAVAAAAPRTPPPAGGAGSTQQGRGSSASSSRSRR
jgi:soluble lytic murein transglycosylase